MRTRAGWGAVAAAAAERPPTGPEIRREERGAAWRRSLDGCPAERAVPEVGWAVARGWAPDRGCVADRDCVPASDARADVLRLVGLAAGVTAGGVMWE
ncbi:MAG: hypothetical protein WAK93_00820 [Solirubrobacteraceae bacterium]